MTHVGMFLNATFDGSGWTETEEVREPDETKAGLTLSVHDSDIVWLAYVPRGSGEGVAWLHQTARACFGDESIPATDPDREAAGLTVWLREHWQTAAEVEGLDEVVRQFVVGDDQEPSADRSPLAESTLADFLRAVRLPLPPKLA